MTGGALDLDAPLREQQHRVNVQQAQAWLRNATNLENRQPTTDLAREVVALASELAEARAALDEADQEIRYLKAHPNVEAV